MSTHTTPSASLQVKLEDCLKTVFGHSHFKGVQADVIGHVLEHKSALAIMPTGHGKSLCYQLPALCTSGLTVVISPLIALIDAQCQGLQSLGIAAMALHSNLDDEQYQKTMSALHDNCLKLLYIAPERLESASFLALLKRLPVSLFAIDEAHCICRWGKDFRPSYNALFKLVLHFNAIPRLALTATASPETQQYICEKLHIMPEHVFISGYDRANLTYKSIYKQNAFEQLQHILLSHQQHAGIIYCLSKRMVESVYRRLSELEIPCLLYHAGLSQEERVRNQRAFLTQTPYIMVATVAFGMGIDKADVRFVVHYGLPKDLETYAQGAGRAGRDGKDAHCYVLYGMDDLLIHQKLIGGIARPAVNTSLAYEALYALLEICLQGRCLRHALINHFASKTPNACECLLPVTQTLNFSIPAQMFLSCMLRVEQKTSISYVIDVLCGKATKPIQCSGHDTLTTFGIGKALSKSLWQWVVLHLLVARFVTLKNLGSSAIICLTERGAQFLKDKPSLLWPMPEVLLNNNNSYTYLSTEFGDKVKVNI